MVVYSSLPAYSRCSKKDFFFSFEKYLFSEIKSVVLNILPIFDGTQSHVNFYSSAVSFMSSF